eukprot:scaffold5234_cov131-Cylindrotheca_fusiformis.AAC.1
MQSCALFVMKTIVQKSTTRLNYANISTSQDGENPTWFVPVNGKLQSYKNTLAEVASSLTQTRPDEN